VKINKFDPNIKTRGFLIQKTSAGMPVVFLDIKDLDNDEAPVSLHIFCTSTNELLLHPSSSPTLNRFFF
jgi:hypothetical protein